MGRITEKMLKARVQWLNEMTNNPTESYIRNDDGMKAQIGNYHIDGAYGGVSLYQIVNDGGGIRDVFQCGHVPKRELFDRICAFMEGIRTAQDAA